MEELKNEGRLQMRIMSPGGSWLEGIGGLLAVVLAIIGLSTVGINSVDSVAVICVGLGLLLDSGAIGARFSSLLTDVGKSKREEFELKSGLTVEFLGGLAGIVLGIIALAGLYPTVLLAVAVLVYGAVLVLDTGMLARLNNLKPEAGTRFEKDAVWAAAVLQLILGCATIIFGIMALSGDEKCW